jgi:hypothetical protein
MNISKIYFQTLLSTVKEEAKNLYHNYGRNIFNKDVKAKVDYLNCQITCQNTNQLYTIKIGYLPGSLCTQIYCESCGERVMLYTPKFNELNRGLTLENHIARYQEVPKE